MAAARRPSPHNSPWTVGTKSSAIPHTRTRSWTASFTMLTESNSPAKACDGPEANRTRRVDHTASPMPEIHRPERLATRAASFRNGGRHHPGIPGGIIPLYPGGFVGIRTRTMSRLRRPPRPCLPLSARKSIGLAGEDRTHDKRGQETCRAGRAEKSGRHRCPERVRAATMVEAAGMADEKPVSRPGARARHHPHRPQGQRRGMLPHRCL